MISYPNISPSFLTIGTLEFRWYGLMYSLSFLIGYFVARHLLKTKRFNGLFTATDLLDFFMYVLLGVIIGGRIGYVLFYNLPLYLDSPLSLLAVWEGGMSFHGGLIGVIIACLLFCRKKRVSLIDIGDFLVLLVPIGLGLGRIGNFINAELFGRVTDVPWCMQFPTALGCRHPSQLYEFFLEGVVLFIVLWIIKNRKTPTGVLTWSFLLFYGMFRFLVEFFREPDVQVGYIFNILTMGQLLSIPLFILGGIGVIMTYRAKTTNVHKETKTKH